jgi:hypothetical protein
MENNNETTVDTLYLGSDGVVYRIYPDAFVVDQHIAVEIPYSAFLRLSNKDSQVGIDTLLSPNAISNGTGYSSRNISVLHIPTVGMAWATRVSTTLPHSFSNNHTYANQRIGRDFLFLWPPGKALSAFLTVVEQTRVDNRTRFLSTCDPTPQKLFTDWDTLISTISTPVDPADLTVSQRIFAASFKPMVHLASPRYTIDLYCSRRSKEEVFLRTNAPIQLKYSGLKRLRNGENKFPGSPQKMRRREVEFCTEEDTEFDNEESTQNENSPVLRDFKELWTGRAAVFTSRRTNPGIRPLTPITPTRERTWDANVTEDVQCCIIEAVVHQALNTMDEIEAINAIRNTRLVSRSFCEKTDHSVHSVLVDAYSNAKRFCEPIVGVQHLEGLLLKRSWWDNCRLPYMGLLSYRSVTPRSSVNTLASIVFNNNHKPYPLCNVLPTVDPSNTKRRATMEFLQNKIRDLGVYTSGIKC